MPALLTFDIFGTVVDWRRGLEAALRAEGIAPAPGDFDRTIDLQAALEQERFRPYREITARSLVAALGVPQEAADRIGAAVGTWPLYPDAREGLRRLQALAPCAAMTNSDRAHGEQARAQLGFPLAAWVCAEDLGFYKPNPEFWRAVAARLGVEPSPAWWHVSAYADYDLDAAAGLGLTTVFVERPHARPGPATHRVRDLGELADLAEGLQT
ncbi:MAG TPA: HAD-IA family hydrolase [Thermoanaerobaculia bacterium]|nr:HAD-IA family hydrolase [Thermoanaerobaculia bacterium]